MKIMLRQRPVLTSSPLARVQARAPTSGQGQTRMGRVLELTKVRAHVCPRAPRTLSAQPCRLRRALAC
ncbi:hypothetical protein TIFTF001_039274 [Ficus carica]|uniref:Uncharacterized protein n=1 Tax=Ficus carica TaxID=3494 RepID=A0AA88EAH8_FICCA|nr:hypothetical protein TIFTF001_039274 [Ficus carica]